MRLGFHLAAEPATALTLITAGMALLLGASWGRPLYLIAAGMLFYTAIVSSGYFAHQGQRVWPGIFAL
jgi:hypothetical protein